MKKAVMYGAGNIGRGFIGQTFSLSGYEVVFVDVNKAVVDALNQQGSYTVQVVSNDGGEAQEVSPVRAVDGTDVDAVAMEIASADIMATAVGVGVLTRIAGPLARGIAKRLEAGAPPLNILICENMLGADSYLKNLVRDQLPPQWKDKLGGNVGFVEASIGRMVPVMNAEQQQKDPLLICVEAYNELPLDKDALLGDVALFHAKPFSPFDFYIRRKLFIHNLGHATAGYLGYFKGIPTIWEAMEQPDIARMVRMVMEDSGRALSSQFGVPYEEIAAHIDDLLQRFCNRPLGDTTGRVGRDPLRKLSPDDRLIGALKNCVEQGRDPIYLPVAVAAALHFDWPEDPVALNMQKTIATVGPEEFLRNHCGLEGEYASRVLSAYYALSFAKPSRG